MKIKNKLFIAFAAITIIPVILLGFLIAFKAEESLKEDKLNYLNSVVDAKVHLINGLIDNVKHDLTILQYAYTIKNSLPLLTSYINDRTNPEYMKGEMLLSSGVLKAYTERAFVKNLMLLNAEGVIVYSTNKNDTDAILGKKSIVWSEGNLVKWREGIWNSNIIRSDDSHVVIFVAPDFDSAGKIIGFISIVLNLKTFYDALQKIEGLGETGESLIGIREGDEIIYISPLRYMDQSRMPYKMPFNSNDDIALPMKEALNGLGGSGIANDYRGTSVIAAWRYIPALKLGLISQIDTSEAFASIYLFRNMIIAFAVILIILATLLSRFIANAIAKPIIKLREGTKVIQDGNFNFKVGIESRDEVGALSKSFDDMISKLKEITVSRNEYRKAEEEVRTLLKEKEIILKEVHHRIKNNMNTLIAILEIHANNITNAETLAALNDASNRIRSMCLLYDRLYMAEDFNEIAIKPYFENLTDMIVSNFPIANIVEVKKNIEDFKIASRKILCFGIIINEILTNTMKYAFKGRNSGTITVSAVKSDDRCIVTIMDDGVGLPPEFDFKESKGFGMHLVKMMSEQIGGTIKTECDKGMKFTLEFKN